MMIISLLGNVTQLFLFSKSNTVYSFFVHCLCSHKISLIIICKSCGVVLRPLATLSPTGLEYDVSCGISIVFSNF